MKISLDFETYSEAGYYQCPATGKVKGRGSQGKGGIGVVGAPAYAEHPSTEVICLQYDLGYGTHLWTPDHPKPELLFAAVPENVQVHGWNIEFEFYIWNMVCRKKYGWPALRLMQCFCTAARSRRFSFPGKLDVAAKVIGGVQKDSEGARLIRLLSVPHTPTKKRDNIRVTKEFAPHEYEKMYSYCETDVRTEMSLAEQLPELTPYERQTWLDMMTINIRGVQVDTVTVESALEILRQAEIKYTQELQFLTGSYVMSVGEVARLKDWANDNGANLEDCNKISISKALEDPELPEYTRRVLEIRQVLGSASVKKFKTFQLQVNSDGRLRSQYIYCGADRTGRATSGGVQLQNLTSGGPNSFTCGSCGRIFNATGCPCGNQVDIEQRKEWDIDGAEWAIKDINTRDLATVERNWGNPIDALSGVVRSLLIAKEGHELICCDFSAIEAVVLACLSGCQWRIDVFKTHGKIYEASVAQITGKSVEYYLKYEEENGHSHADRKLGKVAELASGYQGWIGAWKAFGADKFMSEEEIKEAILAWRAASPEIVEFWGGQFRQHGPSLWDCHPELYGLEGAAISAILRPGNWFTVGYMSYVFHKDTLYCRLPSGRFLHYQRARLVEVEDRLGRGLAYKIVFEGYNTNPNNGPIGWIQMDTYGGKLAENGAQAISADIQFEAVRRLEVSNFPIVMHTHDELIAEVPKGLKTPEEMAAIMSQRPRWAPDWPIRAKGWAHTRYHKD